jgi:hypothetical protein
MAEEKPKKKTRRCYQTVNRSPKFRSSFLRASSIAWDFYPLVTFFLSLLFFSLSLSFSVLAFIVTLDRDKAGKSRQ